MPTLLGRLQDSDENMSCQRVAIVVARIDMQTEAVFRWHVPPLDPYNALRPSPGESTTGLTRVNGC